MKTYQCHKKVQAFKISHMDYTFNGFNVFGADCKEFVPRSWFDKHNPEVGGYYVKYEDGYTSYSPAAAFESGYTEIDPSTEFNGGAT